MEVWVGMLWNFVFVKMVVWFSLNQYCTLVKIKFLHPWWWGKRTEGSMFGENVCPFVSGKSYM